MSDQVMGTEPDESRSRYHLFQLKSHHRQQETAQNEASARPKRVRLLMYSHDTFGLGHLRRCRTIAHALVARFTEMEVLIISGSPIAGAFDFRARVDFIKIPSVVKLNNGEYVSTDAERDINDIIRLREAMIYHTAVSFAPDLIIVDKEPLGLKGELERTLTFLKSRGCYLVLGLREILDDPERLYEEWVRKDVPPKLDLLYHQIWVYGPRGFWNPLDGLNISANVEHKITYTGFLRRAIPKPEDHPLRLKAGTLLATAGGGGDGAELMHQVLAAYLYDPVPGRPLMLVPGPFLNAEDREQLHQKATQCSDITIIDFDTDLETLMQEADAVIAMGGYNTFCEIVSLDKRALIVPRLIPRQEQLIRARRASELGYVDMLLPEEAQNPATLAKAMRALPARALPSEAAIPPDLEGLTRIIELVDHMIHRCEPHFDVIEGGQAG